MITIDWIKPAQIRDHWPLIKEGLKKVESLSKEWLVEDVYMSLRMGTCNLHILTIDGEYKGFTVTQQQDSYGSPVLHVWMGYSTADDFDILKECLNEIKLWAKAIEAKKITFGSPRKGWAKQAIKLGFKASPLITYTMDL